MDVALGLVLVSALLAVAPAQASRFAFDRAFGLGVDAAAPGAGYEICTVAATCKGSVFGPAGGQFSSIRGLTTDAAGNTFVADTDNLRIQKFDAAGNFLSAWGKDVVVGGGTGFEICTVVTSCKTGVFGGLGGEFIGAEGVAVDPAGNVYVADHTRVQKFNSAGVFQRMWGKDVLAGGGTGPELCTVAVNCTVGNLGAALGGEFNFASSVAVAPGGDVVVGEGNGHRIQRFNSSGTFQRAWGKDVLVGGGVGPEICTVAMNCKAGVTGALGGEFGNPAGLAVGPGGDIYTGDYVNRRLDRFDATGNFISAWGNDVIAGGATGPEICTVSATCKVGAFGGMGGGFQGGMEVATDAAGNVYAADAFNNRIQQFDAAGTFLMTWGRGVDSGIFGGGFEVCKVAASCNGGQPGVRGGEFDSPAGVGVDAAGNVYTAEYDNSRVQKFVPAADPPPPPPPPPSASSDFVIGRLIGKRLQVTVPGPGVLLVSGKLLKQTHRAADAAGEYLMPLRLAKSAKQKLKRKHKVRLKASVTFTPDGGTANTLTKKLKIKRKKPRPGLAGRLSG